MKRQIYAIIFVLFISTYVGGQNLVLSKFGTQLNSGDTITVYIANDVPHEEWIDVTNIGNIPISVKVRKHTLELLTDAVSWFCWGQCFSPVVEVSPEGIIIGAEQTYSGFYAGYDANGTNGLSVVRYIFFDENNIEDSVDVVIKFYSTPAFIPENVIIKAEISHPYPNPAGNKCEFTYFIPNNISNAKIVISDILGNRIYTVKLFPEKRKVTIDVSMLLSGIYFYSLLLNDKPVITRKLLVQR